MATRHPKHFSPKLSDDFTETLLRKISEIAENQLRKERAENSLEIGDLINEAWLILDRQRNLSVKERSTYLAAAAVSIRRILIDHARKKNARIEGRMERLEVRSSIFSTSKQQDIDILNLERALENLSVINKRAAEVVSQRFYGGMSIQEIANHQQVSTRTIDSDWNFARAWLSRELAK